MADSGCRQLRIRARAESLEDVAKNEGARSREVFRSGDRVVILEIIDNGCGIAPRDAGRLFDPFFTTKATGLGTGLGLSVARRIVELHGGQITLHNRTRERGAIARLILPTKLGTGKVRTTMIGAKEIDTPAE